MHDLWAIFLVRMIGLMSFWFCSAIVTGNKNQWNITSNHKKKLWRKHKGRKRHKYCTYESIADYAVVLDCVVHLGKKKKMELLRTNLFLVRLIRWAKPKSRLQQRMLDRSHTFFVRLLCYCGHNILLLW